MSVTIPLGTWLLPLAITLASFGVAIWRANNQSSDNGLFPLGGVLAAMIFLPFAAIASLMAWLIWALIG